MLDFFLVALEPFRSNHLKAACNILLISLSLQSTSHLGVHTLPCALKVHLVVPEVGQALFQAE